MQNYTIDDNRSPKYAEGSFYNTWGLAFVLIFLFLFQLIFFFLSVYSAGIIYGLSFSQVQNLLSEPDGTALAINIARYTNLVNFTGYMALPGLLFTLINRRGIVSEGGFDIPLRRRLIFLSILILALAVPIVDFMTNALQHTELPRWLKHYADYFQHTRNESLETILDMERPAELVFCLFALALLPALFEEYMFRGIMLNIFRKITDRKITPVFLQAFVFTVLHFSVYEFPGILFMGILFGYIAIKTGTILYGIILHFLFNATSVILAYLNHMEFEKSGVYGKYGSLALSPWMALAALAGIWLLIRLFNRVIMDRNPNE